MRGRADTSCEKNPRCWDFLNEFVAGHSRLLLAPCMDWESKVARCFQYFPITSQFLPCHTPLPFLDTLTKLHYRIWNCDSIRVHKTNAGDTNRVGLSVPAIKRAAGASESRRASGGS